MPLTNSRIPVHGGLATQMLLFRVVEKAQVDTRASSGHIITICSLEKMITFMPRK